MESLYRHDLSFTTVLNYFMKRFQIGNFETKNFENRNFEIGHFVCGKNVWDWKWLILKFIILNFIYLFIFLYDSEMTYKIDIEQFDRNSKLRA